MPSFLANSSSSLFVISSKSISSSTYSATGSSSIVSFLLVINSIQFPPLILKGLSMIAPVLMFLYFIIIQPPLMLLHVRLNHPIVLRLENRQRHQRLQVHVLHLLRGLLLDLALHPRHLPPLDHVVPLAPVHLQRQLNRENLVR